jgi:sugar phosphate isomerase/epimerase
VKLAVEVGNIGDGSVEATIRYCKGLSIEGIGVPWATVPGFGEKGYITAEPVKAIRAQIEDAGLEFAGMVGWVQPAVTNGDAEGEAMVDNLRRSLDAMGAVGSDTLVAFPPVRPETPWDQVVAFYRKFAAAAEQNGVRIATHTHGVLNNEAILTRLMNDAPSPSNGICFCTGNIWHGDGAGMYDVTRRLADKIFFVHIRNVKTGQGEKEYWLHEGDVDLPRFMQVLKDIGYDGFLRSEHLPTDQYRTFVPTMSGVSDVGAAWAAGYLRPLM